jgi:hypothetical protein
VKELLKQELVLFVRSLEGPRLAEYFIVFAVFAIVSVRVFLGLTGYPQLGTEGLHIAHMLWGGLAMLISMILALGFLNKEARKLSAIIGGVGFGLFIDEIGKFVTHDNNYFFQPTFALIYLIFVGLYFSFQTIAKATAISPKEYAINAIEVLKDIIYYDLDMEEKKLALSYLHRSDIKNPLVKALKEILEPLHKEINPHNLSWLALVRSNLKQWYIRWGQNEHVTTLISNLFVLLTVTRFVITIFTFKWEWSFWDWGRHVSSLIVLVFVLIGLNYQRIHKHLNALRSYRKAAMVAILVGQFFDFYHHQLLAVLFLSGYVLIYLTLQYLIEQEQLV